jgi:hypothetical protein
MSDERPARTPQLDRNASKLDPPTIGLAFVVRMARRSQPPARRNVSTKGIGPMNPNNHWHPTWHKDAHTTSWERVKEAIRRDWQQTEHDLHLGGHELNQGVKDTFKQAAGKEAIPSINQANPPKVIGDLSGEWEHVETPLEYGYAARQQFAAKKWDDELEKNLRTEWESPTNAEATSRKWDDIKTYVRRGYDYKS